MTTIKVKSNSSVRETSTANFVRIMRAFTVQAELKNGYWYFEYEGKKLFVPEGSAKICK